MTLPLIWRAILQCLFVASCCVTPLAGQSVQIQVVDVGQGDGILIRTPHKKWVLIDAGPNRMLADSLSPHFGVDRLALVILSHRHRDHFAGLERVLNTMTVDRFVGSLADCPGRTTDNRFHIALARFGIERQSVGADTIEVDSVRFIVLPTDPVDDPCPSRENNNSIVVRMEYGAFSMLFAGDAESGEREWLVANYPQLLDVEVLKAAHHGSDNGTSQTWLAAVTPKAVVISAGVNAGYHHPMPEAVESYFAATNGKVFCTNRVGTLRVLGYPQGHFTVHGQWESTKSCVYDGTHY